VAAGEDHHTRSSIDDPLVAAWYVMDRRSQDSARAKTTGDIDVS
jgi:hypothetical protein